nr:hypothetical protein [uncultured Rhodopila sp.]
MTTSRALTERILAPMVRVAADGLARLGLEFAPDVWDEAAAEPVAVLTDNGVRATLAPVSVDAMAITPAQSHPAASAAPAVTVPQNPGRNTAVAPRRGGSIQPAGEQAGAPAIVNGHRADAPADPALAVSPAAATAPPLPQPQSRNTATAPRPGDRAPAEHPGVPDAASAPAVVTGRPADSPDEATMIAPAHPNACADRTGVVSPPAANAASLPTRQSRDTSAGPDDRALDYDPPAPLASARASAPAMDNAHPVEMPGAAEATGTDLPMRLRVQRTAPVQSSIRLPASVPSPEAGEPISRTFEPGGAPHAADTHAAALDPAHRPFAGSSHANGADATGATAMDNANPVEAPAAAEATGTDLPMRLRVHRTAPVQSSMRLPASVPSPEAGEPTSRTFEPDGAPHAADTHAAALDPAHRPFAGSSHGVDSRVPFTGDNKPAPPLAHATPLTPRRIPVRPVTAAPRYPGQQPPPRSSGSAYGIGSPATRETGSGMPPEPPANATLADADRLRQALSPILRAAPRSFEDDGIGLGDDDAPAAGATPQLRSTVNVNVAIGSAGAAAAWNAAEPAVRESLRDALIEILRDDARRQGIDL